MLDERKMKMLHRNIKDIFSRSQFIEKWRGMEYSGYRNRAGEESFFFCFFGAVLPSVFPAPCSICRA